MKLKAFAVLGATFLMLVTTRPALSQAGRVDRLGVYIGVDEYDDPTLTVRVHSTNERHLVPLLSDRFGVEWVAMVRNQEADRNGIREALLALLDRVRERVAEGVEVTAVVFYTGHGSRVLDQDGDEADDDGLDETWVTVRSTLTQGAEDIRDDDLGLFRRAVLDTGAELVMILESCHSQTAFRGDNGLRMMRPRHPEGPPESLFPELAARFGPEDGKVSAEMLDEVGQGEHFICLSACQDNTVALTQPVNGEEWGRFSLALFRALGQIEPGDSYRRLHARMLDEFSRHWSQTTQRPTLYAGDAGMRDTRFLGGAFPPAHWPVSRRDDGRVVMPAGMAAGFRPGTRIDVYESLEALTNGTGTALGEAYVTEADLVEATLTTSLVIPEGAVGVFVATGLADTGVYLDGALPDEVRDALVALHEAGRIDLVDDPALATFVVEMDGRHVVLTTRDAAIASSPPGRAGLPAPSIASWNPAAFDNGEVLAANVVCRTRDEVRRQRFLSLVAEDDDIEVSIELADGREPGADGVIRLLEGERFTIRVVNGSPERRFLYLFDWTQTAAGHTEFEALPGGGGISVEPGSEWRSSATATLRRVGGHPPAAWDRTILRIVVTSEPVSGLAMLDRPSCMRSRGPADADPFAAMLDDVMDGGMTLRGGAGDLRWAAMNTSFEVHAAPTGETGPDSAAPLPETVHLSAAGAIELSGRLSPQDRVQEDGAPFADFTVAVPPQRGVLTVRVRGRDFDPYAVLYSSDASARRALTRNDDHDGFDPMIVWPTRGDPFSLRILAWEAAGGQFTLQAGWEPLPEPILVADGRPIEITSDRMPERGISFLVERPVSTVVSIDAPESGARLDLRRDGVQPDDEAFPLVATFSADEIREPGVQVMLDPGTIYTARMNAQATPYRLTVALAEPLSLSGSEPIEMTGNLSASEEAREYRFVAGGNGMLTASMGSEALDSHLTLYRDQWPRQAPLAQNDDYDDYDARIHAELTAGVPYVLRAARVSGQGPFDVRLRLAPFPEPVAIDLDLDEVVRLPGGFQTDAATTADDMSYADYHVTTHASGVLVVNVDPEDAGILVEIFHLDNEKRREQIAEGLGGAAARVEAEDLHLVRLAAIDPTNEFDFALGLRPPPTASTVELGRNRPTTIDGELTYTDLWPGRDSPYDAYRLANVESIVVLAAVRSDDFDTTLTVLSVAPDGSANRLFWNDDVADDTHSALRCTLDAGINYEIRVGAYDDWTFDLGIQSLAGSYGPYTLVLTTFEARQPLELVPGVPLELAGDPTPALVTAEHRFVVREPGEVSIRLEAAGVVPAITVFGKSVGTVATVAGDLDEGAATVSFAAVPGTVYITWCSFEDEDAGPYRLIARLQSGSSDDANSGDDT